MSAQGARRYLVKHVSEFNYQDPAHGSLMVLRLRPREDQRQRILAFNLHIDPFASPAAFEDSFGNVCHLLNVHREHRRAIVHSRSQVEIADAPVPVGRSEREGWDSLADMVDPVRHWEYLRPSRFAYPCPALDSFTATNGIRRGASPLCSLLETASTLHAAFTYEPGSTAVDSSIEQVLETGRGVCQDYTHVMIAIARSWGIPSRYVSGYLHLEGARGEQAQVGASHSWAEFLLPDMGWIGIDPTNDSRVDHRHIRTAVGRDYDDASPTRGVVYGGGESSLKVWVAVAEDEEPAPVGEAHVERANLRDIAPRPSVPRSSHDQ